MAVMEELSLFFYDNTNDPFGFSIFLLSLYKVFFKVFIS